MRRLCLLAGVVIAIACKGSTDPSQNASPYKISVASISQGGGPTTPYITNLTFLVVDTGTTTPHQGVGVTLQIDVGQITSPLPNITDAQGRTSVTWSIDTANQHVGSTHTLGYCAVPPGKTFCKTSLIGSQTVTAQF